MFDLRSILVALGMMAVLNQPVFASPEFNIEEMAACVPVGKIAMQITELRELGYKKELIESSLKKQLDENLSLWIKPISRLVFSSTGQSSEKVIKQAIDYCLHTIKMHKKRQQEVDYVYT